jgi:hypothetical protein
MGERRPPPCEHDGRRGAGQKKSTDPPVYLLNLRPTHPPSDFFFLDFFLVRFFNTIKIFLQKVHVEKKSKYFDKNFDVSFPSTFFVLSRFRVFFSDGSSKALQKTFYKKKSCRIVFTFYKKSDQKSKTNFFTIFFLITFLGVSR